MKTPSIKRLELLFGEDAKNAKFLLTMTRSELLQVPAGIALLAQCHNLPMTSDIRMECLNALGGFHGVEGFETKKGYCIYLNAGDTYAPTLLKFNGNYIISTWGDIAERYLA